MPLAVKILLFSTIILIVVGTVTAFVLNRRDVRQTSDKGQATATSIVIPTASPTQTNSENSQVTTPTPTAPASQSASLPNKRKVRNPQTMTYFVEEEYQVSTSAWARAGINEDGSTYAESHAE